jgi:hypothetical protein
MAETALVKVCPLVGLLRIHINVISISNVHFYCPHIHYRVLLLIILFFYSKSGFGTETGSVGGNLELELEDDLPGFIAQRCLFWLDLWPF